MKTTTAIFLASLLLAACTSATEPDPGFSAAGTVYAAGNEPFTFLALATTDSTSYQLAGSHTEELWTKQGRRVQVQGTIAREQLEPGIQTIIVDTYQEIE